MNILVHLDDNYMEDKNINEIVDNTKIAETVSEKIPYETLKQFLVKPLDPIKVKKEFSKPVPSDEQKGNVDGIYAVDYDKVETEVKEVESNYRKGIVLKVPYEYQAMVNSDKFNVANINVGDTIVYKAGFAQWFDLLKDSQLVDSYSIVALVK